MTPILSAASFKGEHAGLAYSVRAVAGAGGTAEVGIKWRGSDGRQYGHVLRFEEAYFQGFLDAHRRDFERLAREAIDGQS